jgi:WD40 repeat protein
VCHFEDDFTIREQRLDYETTTSAIWSPDNRWLVSTNAGDPTCWIKIFDVTKDFELVKTIDGMICGVDTMAWSPDGQRLAVGSDKLWLVQVQSR